MGTRRPLADKRENPLRDLSAIYRYTVYIYMCMAAGSQQPKSEGW